MLRTAGLLGSVAALLAAPPAFAGRPEAVLPVAEDGRCPDADGKFSFVVDRHALVEGVTVSAEGWADGRRVSLPLVAQACAPVGAAPGHPHGRALLAVPRAWPTGTWRVRVTLTYRLD